MGVVYRLKCSETGQVYYGKFKGTWKQRCSTGWSNMTCRDFINPTHEFIEIDIPNDKLVERENWYINNNECVNLLGKYIHLTVKEYNKQYRINNKEIIKQQNKQYYADNIEKRKQYGIDNKEIIAKKKKQYWIDNKERMNQKIKCNNCGSTINKQNLKKHQTSKKCVNFIE